MLRVLGSESSKGAFFIMGTTIPISGAVTVPTQRGLDAVADLGLDSSGQTDCAATLNAYLSATRPAQLHFPVGRYYLAQPVVSNAALIRITGDGQTSNVSQGEVTFFTDQAMDQMFWFNCPTANSNLESVWLENIQFQGTSPGTNQIKAALRITNQANIHLGNVGGYNLLPQRYTAGTVGVTKDARTVTGSGTWTPAMVPGFLIVGGYPYEIAAVNAPNQLTLAINYQGATASSLGYAISSGGIFLWLDPGLNFTQYGQVTDFKCRNVGVGVYCSAGGAGRGTSRIKFLSGYGNGFSLADGIAAYFGPFSDTMKWSLAMNSWAFGVVIANGHMHDLTSADFENAGSAPPVTGGAAGYAGPKGVLIMSDNSSDTWGNRVIDSQFRQVGTAIELLAGTSPPTRTKVAFNVFRSNAVNFMGGNATETAGEVDGVFMGKMG